MGTSEQAETKKELTRIQRLLFIGPPNFSRMGRAECHTYTSVTLVTVLGTTVSSNKSKGRLRGGQSLSLKSHSLQRTCPGALPHTLLGWCSLPLSQNKSFKEESGRPFRAEFRDSEIGSLGTWWRVCALASGVSVFKGGQVSHLFVDWCRCVWFKPRF